MANPFDIQEAALIEMSRLTREQEDCTATRRVLMLIDAGKTLEEAQRIVFGTDEVQEWERGLAA